MKKPVYPNREDFSTDAEYREAQDAYEDAVDSYLAWEAQQTSKPVEMDRFNADFNRVFSSQTNISKA